MVAVSKVWGVLAVKKERFAKSMKHEDEDKEEDAGEKWADRRSLFDVGGEQEQVLKAVVLWQLIRPGPLHN